MDGENVTAELAQRRWRLPRFSLLTLLLFMVTAALTLTTVLLVREVRPLRVENKRLNEERGTLMIADRSTLQAIRIPDQLAGEGRESFRVFIPADSLYWVFLIVNEVPKSGYPTLESYPKPYSTLGGSTSPVSTCAAAASNRGNFASEHRCPRELCRDRAGTRAGSRRRDDVDRAGSG
jgi:hypothetical protein